MSSKAYGGWLTAGFDMWQLGAEAGTVMALRMARIAAGGPAGTAEGRLMVSEKVRAAIELQTRLMTGGLGHTPLSGTKQRWNITEARLLPTASGSAGNADL